MIVIVKEVIQIECQRSVSVCSKMGSITDLVPARLGKPGFSEVQGMRAMQGSRHSYTFALPSTTSS